METIKNKLFLILRRILHRKNFKRFGKGTRIYGKIICLGNNLEIGKYSTLNEGVLLNAKDDLKIGNFCRLAPLAQIYTAGLNLKEDYKNRSHVSKPVVIGDGVWLGYRSIITPGITIGEGSVVKAGSVVTQDIPKFEIWGGIPAKKIRSLASNNLK